MEGIGRQRQTLLDELQREAESRDNLKTSRVEVEVECSGVSIECERVPPGDNDDPSLVASAIHSFPPRS